MQAAGGSINAPRAKSWSNRQGVSLTPITTGVWAAERPFIWNSIDVGGRSVVARMKDGSLCVHSPVEWEPELGACLEALGGGVGHIIAPSYEHLKYTQQWATQYPDADVYACPGLPPRMPAVAFAHEVNACSRIQTYTYTHRERERDREREGGREGESESERERERERERDTHTHTRTYTQLPDASAAFADSLAFTWLDCEVNPFTGKPFFNEVGSRPLRVCRRGRALFTLRLRLRALPVIRLPEFAH